MALAAFLEGSASSKSDSSATSTFRSDGPPVSSSSDTSRDFGFLFVIDFVHGFPGSLGAFSGTFPIAFGVSGAGGGGGGGGPCFLCHSFASFSSTHKKKLHL